MSVRMKASAALPLAAATATVACTVAVAFVAGATVGAEWQKKEVVPVVLVKPGIGGFEPSDGTSIGNTWPKSAVRPVLLVKPAIGGFEPVEGSSIGNSWQKEAVIPVMLVEPNGLSFVPLQRLTDDSSHRARDAITAAAATRDAIAAAATTPEARPSARPGAASPLIESRLEGHFNGWDGETLFKLDNGQIWQQAASGYHYHYTFRPSVTLVRVRGDVYTMHVDGVTESVTVRRLK
jgi:hypothetical protein